MENQGFPTTHHVYVCVSGGGCDFSCVEGPYFKTVILGKKSHFGRTLGKTGIMGTTSRSSGKFWAGPTFAVRGGGGPTSEPAEALKVFRSAQQAPQKMEDHEIVTNCDTEYCTNRYKDGFRVSHVFTIGSLRHFYSLSNKRCGSHHTPTVHTINYCTLPHRVRLRIFVRAEPRVGDFKDYFLLGVVRECEMVPTCTARETSQEEGIFLVINRAFKARGREAKKYRACYAEGDSKSTKTDSPLHDASEECGAHLQTVLSLVVVDVHVVEQFRLLEELLDNYNANDNE